MKQNKHARHSIASLAGSRCKRVPHVKITSIPGKFVLRMLPADNASFLGSLRAIIHTNMHASSQLTPHLNPHLAPRTSPSSPLPPPTHGKNSHDHPHSYLVIRHSTSSATQCWPLPLAPRSAQPLYRRRNYHISPGMYRVSVLLDHHYNRPHSVMKIWRNLKGREGDVGRAIQGHDTGPECALRLVEEPMGSGRSP